MRMSLQTSSTRIRIVGLCFLAFLVGCTGLERWTKGRGYEFDRDYSTINPIGYVLVDGDLRPNEHFVVAIPAKGSLPDQIESSERSIKIDGKAELSQLAKQLADLHVQGDFSSVASARLELSGPYKLSSYAFIPKSGVVQTASLTVVTDVLNTGAMKMRLYDKSGTDITTSFTIPQVGDIAGGIHFSSNNELTLSGSGFFVGYKAHPVRISRVAQERITVPKGGQLTKPNLKAQFIYMDSRVMPPVPKPEAAVCIIPRSFIIEDPVAIRTLPIRMGNIASIMEQFAMTARKTSSPVPPTIWENARKPAGNTIEADYLTEATVYTLRVGARLGLAVDRSEAILVEVDDVTDDLVTLSIQRILIEM